MVQLAVVRFYGCRCGQQVGNLPRLIGKEKSGGNVGDFVQVVPVASPLQKRIFSPSPNGGAVAAIMPSFNRSGRRCNAFSIAMILETPTCGR